MAQYDDEALFKGQFGSLPPKREVSEDKGREQLQQLYRHLDHVHAGDLYIAWYGQLRAEGHEHTDAINLTIEHFRLRSQDWYQARLRYWQERQR